MAHVVVGLGNPGPEYRHTRHNIGHRVLDLLARTLGRAWRRNGPALEARAAWRGETLHLIKPSAFMNVSGPVVARALRRVGGEPRDLILVYDDIDLPLGTVRTRLRGTHGGHNGVRSVIEALGTDEIRRVKVGIGRPDRKEEVADHVLAPFTRDELPAVEAAVAAAADRVLALIHTPSSPSGGSG
ncbi:MAG: aminoacyl-tRNA hydrolase [Candidatus Rokubacteria bacterium]|nr:aminoacyl-tRNA hydrolase [Candidatus Rokubacteria bacterium]